MRRTGPMELEYALFLFLVAIPWGTFMRHARLALLLAVMLALVIPALVVSVPEARRAFTQSPLIIALTGTVAFTAAQVISLLVAASALRRRAARSSLNNHPMRDPVAIPSTQTISP